MDIKKPQNTAASQSAPAGEEKKSTDEKKRKEFSFQIDSVMLMTIAKIIGVVVLYLAVKGVIDFTEYIPQIQNSLLADLVQKIANIYVDFIFIGVVVTMVAGFMGKKIDLNLIQIATYIATGIAAIVMISFMLDPKTNSWWTVVVTIILSAIVAGFAQNKVPARGKPYLLYAIGGAGLVIAGWQLWVLKLGSWFAAGATMFGGAWIFGLLLGSTIFVIYFFFLKK